MREVSGQQVTPEIPKLPQQRPAASRPPRRLPLLPPGTALTLVPGAGHLLPLEAPAAVAG